MTLLVATNRDSFSVVTPAKAGAYANPHARCLTWIPAFAGMTTCGCGGGFSQSLERGR